MSRPAWSRKLRAMAVAGALAVALPACADYLWLQREGGQVDVRAGDLRHPRTALPALRDGRAKTGSGPDLPLTIQGDRMAITVPGDSWEKDLRFTAVQIGADGLLTYFQVRWGRNETQPVNDLELVPTAPHGNTFRLYFKGRPVAASQVNVETSEGWQRTLSPASDGTVSFTPSFPGLYVLEVTARLNDAAVMLDGRKYEDVRYVATLSFEGRL